MLPMSAINYSRKTKKTHITLQFWKCWIQVWRRYNKFNVEQGKCIHLLSMIVKFTKHFFLAQMCSKHFSENNFRTSVKYNNLNYILKNYRKEYYTNKKNCQAYLTTLKLVLRTVIGKLALISKIKINFEKKILCRSTQKKKVLLNIQNKKNN